MGTRKKGSELVFNLQWRSMPDNGGDRSNVVGMYDTPMTTLNFETFKSYLLKNAGVVGNDVKVTYLTDNGAEWIIDSQEWFEIALCAFRLKARLGEVIFLKLDKISTHPQMMRKHSNDVETQFDNDLGAASKNMDAPPDWFLKYMKQFKRDLIQEVTYTVTGSVFVNTKDKESSTPAPVMAAPKKVKSDTAKRCRKHILLGETPIDKELFKTLKFDRKLEIKLDKLDAKTKKIKEKKQALMSKLEQTEDHHQGQNPQNPVDFDGTPPTPPLMDASCVVEPAIVPHMMGGEIYLHSWEVFNSGKLPWTAKTELRLTWGSADMKPATHVIRCPPLGPGEKGTICVRFQIPQRPGQYESYWNFFDRDIRFGHGLSCCVIVDEPVIYLSKKPKIEQQESPTNLLTQSDLQQVESLDTKPKQQELKENFVLVPENSADSEGEGTSASTVAASNVIDLSTRMQEMQILTQPSGGGDSDSEWENMWSFVARKQRKTSNDEEVDNIIVMDGDGDDDDDDDLHKSNKYGINEKDLIVDLSTTKERDTTPEPPPQTVAEDLVQNLSGKIDNDNNNNGELTNNPSSGESICEIASEASSDVSSGYDVISGPIDEEKEDSGYVYVTIDGNKVPVPKHLLRPDFVLNAEEAPGPVKTDEKTATIPNEEKTQPQVPSAAVNVVKLESQVQELEADVQETKSFMSHCSAAGTCFSDFTPSGQQQQPQQPPPPPPGRNHRLFIFPQNNPGYEVYTPGHQSGSPYHHSQPRVVVKTYGMPQPPQPAVMKFKYQPPPPPPQVRVAGMKYDPYGPLNYQNTYHPPVHHVHNHTFSHVPNYQQTHGGSGGVGGVRRGSVPQHKPKMPTAPPPPPPPPSAQGSGSSPPSNDQNMSPVHILPENLVNGAVNVASSAINTARSVINMIVPPKSEPGKWVNGHWVTENPESVRAKNLCILADMGFWDTDLNATLLARYKDDVARVVSELLH